MKKKTVRVTPGRKSSGERGKSSSVRLFKRLLKLVFIWLFAKSAYEAHEASIAAGERRKARESSRASDWEFDRIYPGDYRQQE